MLNYLSIDKYLPGFIEGQIISNYIIYSVMRAPGHLPAPGRHGWTSEYLFYPEI